MRPDELQQQIESLRDEVRRMGKSLNKVREDDIRWVYGEQIRPVLMERVRRSFETAHKEGSLSSRTSAALESAMYELIDRTISVYQRFDPSWGQQVLEQGLAEIRDRLRILEGSLADGMLSDLASQIMQYFDTSNIINRSADIGPGVGTVKDVTPQISGAVVESVLSPLASSMRYDILVTLRIRERGLTDLGKSLDLQKGHLQFHMKSLLASGYVLLDKETRKYSLTKKGETALTALEAMVRQVMA
jgi:hypothetical protein